MNIWLFVLNKFTGGDTVKTSTEKEKLKKDFSVVFYNQIFHKDAFVQYLEMWGIGQVIVVLYKLLDYWNSKQAFRIWIQFDSSTI